MRGFEVPRRARGESARAPAGFGYLRRAGAGGILHGDYRLGNCILDAGDPRWINAVLDWELSTLGDPLADLGLFLFYWRQDGDEPRVPTPSTTAVPGFPGRASIAERYARRCGRDLCQLPQYVAFAHLKFAVIAQGIAARVAQGANGGPGLR